LSIGELGIDAALPPGNRYLWGFVTAPDWRGRGIYPRLLQAILAGDSDGDRFWIGHEPGNDASARGIHRAGFSPIGEVFAELSGRRWLEPAAQADRIAACTAIFGIQADGQAAAGARVRR
jgi:RimJ/RimL family protein N-acetyltransferase